MIEQTTGNKFEQIYKGEITDSNSIKIETANVQYDSALNTSNTTTLQKHTTSINI